MPDLRVIILNYKRQDNVIRIVQVLQNYYPITVINNNPIKPFPQLGQPVEVINNNKNYMCMERWIRCSEYNEEFKLVLDDDVLPSLNLIEKMKSLDKPIVGVYGKTNVKTSNKYEDLRDYWCIDAKVDFLVGSVVMIKQSCLNVIYDSLKKIGYHMRGDDIIVSYLIKKAFNLDYLETVAGEVLMLPEGNVGLNKDPSHFSMRWKVIEKFKNSSW